MNCHIHVISSLLLLLGIAACTSDIDQVPERYIPVYETYQDTPAYHIDIPEQDIIDVPYDAVMAIRAPGGANYEAGLGWLSIATPDSILVVTEKRKTIKSIDIATGIMLNEYSFVGHGPGEYQFISNLQVTDKSVTIADRDLSIINIYDRKWNLIDEILLSDLEKRNPDSDIYHLGSNIYFSSASDENHVIRTINLDDRSDTSASFHRRVIPVGWEPNRYNQVMMDASPSGELLVANTMSPFLFLYQDEELKELYYLALPGLDEFENLTSESAPSNQGIVSSGETPVIENPPPVPIERGKGIVRTYPILRDILYTGDHIIFYYSNWFAKQRFLTVLERGPNQRWQFRGSYRFLKQSGELFHIWSLSYSGPWLYLSSHFEEEILRIDMNELIKRQPIEDAHSQE